MYIRYIGAVSIGLTSYLQGGNSFGADAVIGTNDNFNLFFRTNGTNKLELTTAAAPTLLPPSVTGTGLTFTISGGPSSTGTGGSLTLNGGTPASGQQGGPVTVKGGTSSVLGGSVTVQGGSTTGVSTGGQVNITGGSGLVSGGTGGNIVIKSGQGNGAGPNGKIQFSIATTQALNIDNASNIIPGAAGLNTNAIDGFMYLESCAGVPSATPNQLPTGRVPMIYNSAANTLYFYNSGWQLIGGGGSPGAIVNNGNTFGAPMVIKTLDVQPINIATINNPGAGDAALISLTAGNGGTSAGGGGEIDITAGSSTVTGGTGGGVSLNTGNSQDNFPGDFHVNTGSSGGTDGGYIFLNTGASGAGGNGGDIVLTTGTGIAAGNIELALGANTGLLKLTNMPVEAPNVGALTLANGPSGVTGNPAIYVKIQINGVAYVIPAWTA